MADLDLARLLPINIADDYVADLLVLQSGDTFWSGLMSLLFTSFDGHCATPFRSMSVATASKNELAWTRY
jgi:hypothetical protein